jgi:aromatic ring-cleaving dioxygenase
MKPLSDVIGYHAHIYYDAVSRPLAEALRQQLETAFPDARFGRWHDRPVGPHPDWSFQIAFSSDLFQPLVTFLALNRQGLVIFVHPETGDPLNDHHDHAIWMGAIRPLDLTAL